MAHTALPVMAVDVPTAAKALGMSTGKTWQLIGSGELRSKLVGRRRLVSVEAIREFLGDGAA